MPGFSNAAKNGMLDGAPLRQRISHMSLHTADSATGANEVTGNGYARVATTSTHINAAATGEVVLNADRTFAGPANSSAAWVGIWDSTTFLGMAQTVGDTTFNAAGQFIVKATTTRWHLNG
jgi:hypothetical protein